VRDEQTAARRVVGEAVRTAADLDLVDDRRADGPEDADGVLAAIRREDHVARVVDERAGDRRQPADGPDELLRDEIDHVERVVRGVRDVHAPARRVHGGVIEAAAAGVRRQIDEAEVAEHGAYRPAISDTSRSTRATIRSRALS